MWIDEAVEQLALFAFVRFSKATEKLASFAFIRGRGVVDSGQVILRSLMEVTREEDQGRICLQEHREPQDPLVHDQVGR